MTSEKQLPDARDNAPHPAAPGPRSSNAAPLLVKWQNPRRKLVTHLAKQTSRCVTKFRFFSTTHTNKLTYIPHKSFRASPQMMRHSRPEDRRGRRSAEDKATSPATPSKPNSPGRPVSLSRSGRVLLSGNSLKTELSRSLGVSKHLPGSQSQFRTTPIKSIKKWVRSFILPLRLARIPAPFGSRSRKL